MDVNPYAPPKASGSPPQQETSAVPSLWNPQAAVNWSLLFTPAFGAYLHMQNWRALGRADKAAASRGWFYASLGLALVQSLLALFLSERSADLAARSVGIGSLVAWYYSLGRSQGSYVKEHFGAAYRKKSWAKPLTIASAAAIAFVGLGVLLAIATAELPPP